jgi:hypothetical protein
VTVPLTSGARSASSHKLASPISHENTRKRTKHAGA